MSIVKSYKFIYWIKGIFEIRVDRVQENNVMKYRNL